MIRLEPRGPEEPPAQESGGGSLGRKHTQVHVSRHVLFPQPTFQARTQAQRDWWGGVHLGVLHLVKKETLFKLIKCHTMPLPQMATEKLCVNVGAQGYGKGSIKGIALCIRRVGTRKGGWDGVGWG